MDSITFILWAGLGLIGLFLFTKYRVSTIESNLLDRSEARKVSIDFIREFVGIDVEEWDVYSVYWYDHETVNKLHHLGLLKKIDIFFTKWDWLSLGVFALFIKINHSS